MTFPCILCNTLYISALQKKYIKQYILRLSNDFAVRIAILDALNVRKTENSKAPNAAIRTMLSTLLQPCAQAQSLCCSLPC